MSTSIKENKKGQLEATKTVTRKVKKIVLPSESVAEAIGDKSKAITMEEAIHLLTFKLKTKKAREKRIKLLQENPDLVKKALRATEYYLGDPNEEEIKPEEDTIELLSAAKKRAAEEKKEEGPVKVPKGSLEEIKSKIRYPSTLLVLGKKFSGKTNLIRNLVDTESFDVIILFTVSKHTGNLNMLVKGFCPEELDKERAKERKKDEEDDELCIFEEISDEIIDILLDYQKEHKKSKMLLLFDDFINGPNTLKKAPKILQLATSGRNFGISIIIASQVLTPVLPTTLRKNAEYLFVGKNMLKTAKQIGDEFGTVDLSQKDLTDEIQAIRDHSWLFYDEREAEWLKLPEDEITVHV